jgi:hypothetical protein
MIAFADHITGLRGTIRALAIPGNGLRRGGFVVNQDF